MTTWLDKSFSKQQGDDRFYAGNGQTSSSLKRRLPNAGDQESEARRGGAFEYDARDAGRINRRDTSQFTDAATRTAGERAGGGFLLENDAYSLSMTVAASLDPGLSCCGVSARELQFAYWKRLGVCILFTALLGMMIFAAVAEMAAFPVNRLWTFRGFTGLLSRTLGFMPCLSAILSMGGVLLCREVGGTVQGPRRSLSRLGVQLASSILQILIASCFAQCILSRLPHVSSDSGSSVYYTAALTGFAYSFVPAGPGIKYDAHQIFSGDRMQWKFWALLPSGLKRRACSIGVVLAVIHMLLSFFPTIPLLGPLIEYISTRPSSVKPPFGLSFGVVFFTAIACHLLCTVTQAILIVLERQPLDFEVLSRLAQEAKIAKALQEKSALSTSNGRTTAGAGGKKPVVVDTESPPAAVMLLDAMLAGREGVLYVAMHPSLEKDDSAKQDAWSRGASASEQRDHLLGVDEVDLQRRVTKALTAAAVGRHGNHKCHSIFGHCPSPIAVEERGALPMWAYASRSLAFQSLACHVPTSRGQALQGELLWSYLPKVIRACCLSMNVLALQLQADAFVLDKAAAMRVLVTGDDTASSPSFNLDNVGDEYSWLAAYLMNTPSAATADVFNATTGPLYDLGTQSQYSVEQTLAQPKRKFKAPLPPPPDAVQEAMWAAEGAAKLMMEAAEPGTTPLLTAAPLVPPLLFSLVSLNLSAKALGRCRDTTSNAPSLLEAPELLPLTLLLDRCVAGVVRAHRQTVEECSFPPAVVVCIQNALKPL